MVDADGVTVFDRIQDLEECRARQVVVTNVLTAFSDIGEKIPFRAVFDDYVGAVCGIKDLH